jgi:hypothetical protein
MAAGRKARNRGARATPTGDRTDSAAVTAYLAALDHPLKPVVEAIRGTILGAYPAIAEGVKWNSPSFYCHGWFATANVRPRGGVQVVLHHGAKARADATLGRTIDDPAGLLTWLSADRAVVTFAGDEDFAGKRAAFVALIRQWAAYQARLANKAEPGAAPDRGGR